jgi:hypothetical protein
MVYLERVDRGILVRDLPEMLRNINKTLSHCTQSSARNKALYTWECFASETASSVLDQPNVKF